MTQLTKGQSAANDVRNLIRARNSLIWIVTREENRVEEQIIPTIKAITANPTAYNVRIWDADTGATTKDGVPEKNLAPVASVLRAIAEAAARPTPNAPPKPAERNIWILRDLPIWIKGGGLPQAVAQRALRNLAKDLPRTPKERAQSIIVISPSNDVPPELMDYTNVIEWPLPDRIEIATMLDAQVTSYADKMRAVTPAIREAAIDAAVGLSAEEAGNCFARSLVNLRIDPQVIAGEKKRIVARSGLLEWWDAPLGGLSAVGGLDALKKWLKTRRTAFSAEAREYGLPKPKGIMVVGMSGCGKSYIAKMCASEWGLPLLRLDISALKSSKVGSSEQNLRQVLSTIDAVGPSITWLDEVEKALAGAIGGGGDAGVSADQLGTLLNWMQERKGETFIIATANDIQLLLDKAPEFVRKGRFDEIFFVDLPNDDERIEILKTALKANGCGELPIKHKEVALFCHGYTGAEIANLVPDAMFIGFADRKRKIKTEDLISVAKEIKPFSKTAEATVTKLRAWANTGGVRFATSPLANKDVVVKRGRQVDVDEEA